MKIRLQKILAQAGYGSRRNCEMLIQEAQVKVNGEIAVLGMSVDPQKDIILVNEVEILPK